MLFSTSNAILVTALALNVASTVGAPIPQGNGFTSSLDGRTHHSETMHDSRNLDILVPKKRFREWNKTRRAARENPLPYSASDILDLEAREFEDEQLGRRHTLDNLAKSVIEHLGGMCHCSSGPMPQQCPGNTGGGGNPGIPQPCGVGAAPCPGQPGPTGIDTGLPAQPTDMPPVSAPDGGPSTDPSSPESTGLPDDGSGGSSAAVPPVTDSAAGPVPTGTSGTGNGTSTDDGSGGGSDAVPSATDSSTDPSTTDTPDPSTGNTTDGSMDGTTGSDNGTTTDPSTDPSSTDGTQAGRSLFERWLAGRTSPVRRAPMKRANSARFRL
ncbi:hypothetical protein B0H13DRAFT_2067944 [Mycena leptocephala]|nr:hypothetical protein B0H13DRAFT_2067944 [Mycena leptocephala]